MLSSQRRWLHQVTLLATLVNLFLRRYICAGRLLQTGVLIQVADMRCLSGLSQAQIEEELPDDMDDDEDEL
jgi:hypothetical protein